MVVNRNWQALRVAVNRSRQTRGSLSKTLHGLKLPYIGSQSPGEISDHGWKAYDNGTSERKTRVFL